MINLQRNLLGKHRRLEFNYLISGILFDMKKTIISGHTGFIGMHLVKALKNQHDFIGISNNIDEKSSLFQIKKNITTINYRDVPDNISCIIHLAAVTDIKYCEKNPAKCFRVNLEGTKNMLEISRKLNTKFIFVSTNHVYGTPKKIPIKETYPVVPSSVYSSSKIAGEILCESYSKSYGLDLSILRLFSVYGPNSPSHLVISKIIFQLLNKDFIKLGNLYPKRDFIYVADVVKAIKIIQKKSRGFNIYNVGSGKSYSILNICTLLKKLCGSDSKIVQTKSLMRKDEIPNIVADSSKLKKLGWKPIVSIETGLKKTLNYFQRVNKI